MQPSPVQKIRPDTGEHVCHCPLLHLRSLFSSFDELCEAHRCHKVETAGGFSCSGILRGRKRALACAQYVPAACWNGSGPKPHTLLAPSPPLAGDCYIVSSGLLSVDAEGFAQVSLAQGRVELHVWYFCACIVPSPLSYQDPPACCIAARLRKTTTPQRAPPTCLPLRKTCWQHPER